jgi:hypothetical protein
MHPSAQAPPVAARARAAAAAPPRAPPPPLSLRPRPAAPRRARHAVLVSPARAADAARGAPAAAAAQAAAATGPLAASAAAAGAAAPGRPAVAAAPPRVDVAKMLTNALAGAPTLAALLETAEANAGALNHVHVAVALTRAAALSAAAGPLLHAPAPAAAGRGHADGASGSTGGGGFITEDSSGSSGGGGFLSEVAGSSSSSAAGAAIAAAPAPAPLAAGEATLRRLCALLAQRLRHAHPDTLAASLWALGRLSQLGLGPQLAAALAATPAVADDDGGSGGGSRGAATSSSGGAAARPPTAAEKQRPPRRRAPLLPALGARALTLAPDMSGRQLATCLWGLARAGFAPQPAWLAAWDAAAAAALRAPGRFALADCSVLLHAHALLRAPPGPDCFDAWQSATLAGGLLSAPPHALSTMLWSAGQLGLAPRPDWMAAAFEASGPQLASYDSSDLANAAYGVAALGAPPPDGWADGLAAALERGVAAGGSDSEAADAVRRRSGSEACASGGGSDEDEDGSGAAARPITPYAFATTLAALAKLGAGARLGGGWLPAALARSVGALGAFRPHELASTAWALARLDRAPPDDWLAAFLAACRRELPGFSGPQLVNVIWCAAAGW